MPTTLKQLAKLAGVDPSTISRVATNDTSYRIAPATRARIEKLIAESDYRPHAAARGLKLRRTQVLALVVPDIANPSFAAIFRGAEEVAQEAGFNVILCNTDSKIERELSHVRTLQSGRTDGVILAAAVFDDPAVAWLRDQRIPHVLVSRYSDERGVFVGVDEEEGGRLVANHLLALGHRRIALLGGPRDASTAVLRRRAFRATLAAAGHRLDPQLDIDANFLESGGYEGMTRLLDLSKPPTAVFAANDRTAMGAYDAIEARGLRIPDDVSVVGYNDLPLATHVRPQLTTVRVPFHEFGRTAARLLLARVHDQMGSETRRIILRPELVVRESTAAPRTSGPKRSMRAGAQRENGRRRNHGH